MKSKIRIGTVWYPIRRDSSECIAFLTSDIQAGKTDNWYLPPGRYSGGFLRVTDVTSEVPDNHIKNALAREGQEMTTDEFRKQYTIIRRYSTTTG